MEPPRRDSGRVGRRAGGASGAVADSAARRRGRLVELQHHCPQLHPSSVLPVGKNESAVLRRAERFARYSAGAMARPPSGASCRCLLAIARIAAAWYRNRAGPHIMDRAWLGGAALLSSVVS